MYQLQEEERMILSMVDSVCTDVIADRAAEIDEVDEFPQDTMISLLSRVFSVLPCLKSRAGSR